MVAALAGVESGTVTWSVLAASQDTNDADREPNFGSFTGKILFTPSRSSVRRLLPTPFTIFLDPVLGDVGEDGILRDLSGLPGVVLVSPYATGIEEKGWEWVASFQLNQREKVEIPFRFQPDEVVDLTVITPVSVTGGIVITKGDKGDAASVAVGTTTTGAAGSNAAVANSGTSSAAILDFTIPRGPSGTTPVLAGTSATSFAIGIGSKVFVTQAGMALQVGDFVRIASRANGTNYMAGNITAYSTTSLTVNVTETSGSGTFADWNINIAGVRGFTGPSPVITGTSATSTTPALGSKVFTTQAGMALVVGQYVRIASAAIPADYMAGAITAYTSTSLTVNVDAASGITARTDWNIAITGTTGAQGPAGSGAADATTTTKGSVMLAGDFGGTAALPTVVSGSAATASQIMRRDAAGRAKVANAAAADDIATLGQVQTGDRWTPTLKTGAAYTFALADETNHILGNDTVAQTYTIPANATVAFPLGTKIQVTRWNTGTLTLAPAAGVTLNALSASRSLNQYESCMLIKVAVDSWLIVNLTTVASETVVGSTRYGTAAETTTGALNNVAVHPQGLKVELDKKAAIANVEIVVYHDGTAGGGIRPTGYKRVIWVNPVGTAYARPTNMISGDVWEHD